MAFVYMCVNETADLITIGGDSNSVINFIPETKDINETSEILNLSKSEKPLQHAMFDLQIRMLNLKLKKHLDTLVFLSELETRYTNKNVLLEIIHEYYSIKKAVQIEIVKISNEIAHYKSLQA